MVQAPFDKVIVSIKARYDDEIKFQSGVTLYVDPSFNPNFHAAVSGVVHSVPVSLRHSNRSIKPIIQPGDTVLFSYKVVGDTSFDSSTEMFRMTTKTEGFITEWMNAEREVILLQKGIKQSQWAAVYVNARGERVAGKVGSHGECENWIASNFKFVTGESPTHDNQFYYNDEELWRVDYSYIFAILRDGHMTMVGDYLLIEPIVENKPERIVNSNLIMPDSARYCVREDKGWLRCGERGKDGMKNGDVLIFDPSMKEKYNIEGAPMYIIKRQYVTGKELSVSSIESLSVN